MNLEQSKYVLYFRLKGDASNTAYCALVESIFAASQHLISYHEKGVVWASLLNDSGTVVRDHNHLM